MLDFIAKSGTLLLTLGGLSILFNIVVNDEVMVTMSKYLGYSWYLQGIFPVDILMKTLFLIIGVYISKFVFNFVMGLLGLFVGSGRPEI